jgi:hypothetical protein
MAAPSARLGGALLSATNLDRLMPSWDAHEVHSIDIGAAAAIVYRALFEVTAGEVWLFRTLIALRGLGRRGSRSESPLIAGAQKGGFAILADEPGRELVLGVIGRFWGLRDRAIRAIDSADGFVAFAEPGYARAAMAFLIEPAGAGRCHVTTETRIQATDPRARRAFRRYWSVIHPGSALIRRMWLRALKRRAERA